MEINTVLELKEMTRELSESLEFSESQVKNFFILLKRSNDLLLSNVIRRLEEVNNYEYFVYEIENSYLNKLNIALVKKYKDLNSDEWDFLDAEQNSILNNLKNYYNKILLELQLAKAELISLRKDVHFLIEERLEEIDKIGDTSDIAKILIGEYSLEDSLKELGYKLEDNELKKLKLNRNLVLR